MQKRNKLRVHLFNEEMGLDVPADKELLWFIVPVNIEFFSIIS
jgi:hypothetical protein